MGYAVPAAMGAKVGPPGRHGVVHRRRRLLPDDQPGARDLRDRGHPDQGRHHQQRQPRHGPAVADTCSTASATPTPTSARTSTASPTSCCSPRRWAAWGCARESRDDVDRVDQARRWRSTTSPVVIDFVVGADAQVWPMVAAGTGNDEIMAARDIRPLFDGDELVAGVDEVAAVTAEVRGAAQEESADDRAPHAVGPRGGQARRARPRLGAVLPARVQHRLARRRPDRAPRHLPDDDRRRRSTTSRSSRSPSSSTSSSTSSRSWSWSRPPSVQRELLLVKVRADADGAQPGAGDRSSCSGPRSSTSPPRRSRSRPPAPPRSSSRCCASRALRHPRDGAVRDGRRRPRAALHHRHTVR